MTAPDVVVIGGGPAGSAAAAWLAEAGVRVTLVERTEGPHDKVCGEFVGPGAVAYLAGFGIFPTGAELRTLRLFRGDRVVAAPLPFAAHAFSRREMDERLLAVAADRGAVVRRGVAVRGLDRATLAVSLAGGSTLLPGAVFLATGKHDLRGLRRAASRDDHVGLKMRIRPVAGAPDAIDLLVFPGGYAGYLPLDAASATLCVAVSARRYRELGATWPALLNDLRTRAPSWRDRLDAARSLWPQPLAVAGQPYGFIAPPEAGSVFRIGDQAAVVPSFSGEGIGIAFSTARMAVDAYLKGEGADVHARRVGLKFARVATLGSVSRLGETGIVQALGVAAARFAPGLLTSAARTTRMVQWEE